MSLYMTVIYELNCDKCGAIVTGKGHTLAQDEFKETVERRGWVLDTEDLCPDCKERTEGIDEKGD